MEKTSFYPQKKKFRFFTKPFSYHLVQAARDPSTFEDLRKFIQEERRNEPIDWATFTAFESLFIQRNAWAHNYRAIETVLKAFCFVVRCNTRWENERDWLCLVINVFDVIQSTKNDGGNFLNIILEESLPTIAAQISSVRDFAIKAAISWFGANKGSYVDYCSALTLFEKFLIASKEALTNDFKYSIVEEVIAFSDMITKVGDYAVQLTILSILKDVSALPNIRRMFPSLPRAVLMEFECYSCDELFEDSRKFLNSCNNQALSEISILSLYFRDFTCGGLPILECGGWLTVNSWSETIKIFARDDKLLLVIPANVLLDHVLKAVSGGFCYEIKTRNLKMIAEEFKIEQILGTALHAETSDETFEGFHSFLRETCYWQELKERSQATEERGQGYPKTNEVFSESTDKVARSNIENSSLRNQVITSSDFLIGLLPNISESNVDEAKKYGTTIPTPGIGSFGNIGKVVDLDNAVIDEEDSDCVYLGTFAVSPSNEDNLLTMIYPIKIENESQIEDAASGNSNGPEPFNLITVPDLDPGNLESAVLTSHTSDTVVKNGTDLEQNGASTVPFNNNNNSNASPIPTNVSNEGSINSTQVTNRSTCIASKRSSSVEIPETPLSESPTLRRTEDTTKTDGSSISSNLLKEPTPSSDDNSIQSASQKRRTTTRKKLHSPPVDYNGIILEDDPLIPVKEDSPNEGRSYRIFKSRGPRRTLETINIQNIYDFPGTPESDTENVPSNSMSTETNYQNQSKVKNIKTYSKKSPIVKVQVASNGRGTGQVKVKNGTISSTTKDSENYFSVLKNAQTERITASAIHRCEDVVNNFMQQVQLLEKEALRSLDNISLDSTAEINSAYRKILDLATTSENSLRLSITSRRACLSQVPANSENDVFLEPSEVTQESCEELTMILQAKQQLLKECSEDQHSSSALLIRDAVGKFKQIISTFADHLKIN